MPSRAFRPRLGASASWSLPRSALGLVEFRDEGAGLARRHAQARAAASPPMIITPEMVGQVVISGLLGAALQRGLVRRVVDAPELSSLLLTFGVAIALVNLAQLAFTSDLRSVEYVTGSFVLGPFAFSKSRVIACGFAFFITIGAFVFLQKTRLGKALRAVSQSREVAQVCGINVQRIHMVAFGLASALAAAGGTLVA